MSSLRTVLLTSILLLLAACSTTSISLVYQPQAAMVSSPPIPLVKVGSFSDQRGTDPHWLGAVRGGFGQQLKTLELSESASDVVGEAFSKALASRGLLASGTDGRYTLSGSIQKLDCSQYVRREAHAELVVRIIDNETGVVLMDQPFQRDVVQGSLLAFDTGIFASVEDLQAVATEALQNVVDTALDSQTFNQIASQARRK